ncbi:hypothetical protein IC235_17675 [Hymenobacter sp. BT664]|uniref:Uncharacterized protein n=1 Tax=Hymenobacter montanus TaxID=2771359 RepID=A0A927BGZ1_9BACT|nr:hypothetical protein [Hymenobacter montanus]MBD2769723.1 hypothetical protein [Hymenobacter montanus]
MGINISAVRLRYILPVENYPITDDVPGWDAGRYGGDNEVPTAEGVEWVRPEWDTDFGHNRPADLDVFRDWVLANIPEGCQERWLDIIERMRADEGIWLYFGW